MFVSIFREFRKPAAGAFSDFREFRKPAAGAFSDFREFRKPAAGVFSVFREFRKPAAGVFSDFREFRKPAAGVFSDFREFRRLSPRIIAMRSDAGRECLKVYIPVGWLIDRLHLRSDDTLRPNILCHRLLSNHHICHSNLLRCIEQHHFLS